MNKTKSNQTQETGFRNRIFSDQQFFTSESNIKITPSFYTKFRHTLNLFSWFIPRISDINPMYLPDPSDMKKPSRMRAWDSISAFLPLLAMRWESKLFMVGLPVHWISNKKQVIITAKSICCGLLSNPVIIETVIPEKVVMKLNLDYGICLDVWYHINVGSLTWTVNADNGAWLPFI